jgi:hypothetical protein
MSNKGLSHKGLAVGSGRSTGEMATALSAEAFGNRVAMIAREALSQRGHRGDCPRYLAALTEALDQEPPPFDTEAYSDIYRASSVDPRWMATSLLTNAEMEGDGARRLWSLAACSPGEEEKRQLKRHAVDESKHSLMYLALLDLAFPNSVSPEFRRELRQLSPGFAMHKALFPVAGSPYARAATIDEFLQMNIAEIRTTIHHLMQRRAIRAHCPAENLPAIMRIQDSLLNDELAHVGYTAVLIDAIAEKSDRDNVAALFRKRVRDFNTITTDELGDLAFGCSVACCEKHATCRAKAPQFSDGQGLLN